LIVTTRCTRDGEPEYRMGGSGGIAPPFLTSALDGGEWSASRPCHFTPGERAPGTHCIGGWVGPRTGLDDVERRKILPPPGLELRPLGRPARSQSLYRLSYPGSSNNLCFHPFSCLPVGILPRSVHVLGAAGRQSAVSWRGLQLT
jgi:hypothetical protein